ncbi:hypothetical protein [Streptosporangium vulgare]|uniref:hypothetical protein n=1 Tax=Streptosporangium vulgare TaxID=46190 RepID=UPI0031D58E93
MRLAAYLTGRALRARRAREIADHMCSPTATTSPISTMVSRVRCGRIGSPMVRRKAA